MEVYEDAYFEQLLEGFLAKSDKIQYQDLVNFFLKEKDSFVIIKTKEYDDILYVSEDSEKIVDQFIGLCKREIEKLGQMIENEKQEEYLSSYKKELLNLQKTVLFLKAMKRDILNYRNQSSKGDSDSISFIALPIKTSCSLDVSDLETADDIRFAFDNLKKMENLIVKSMENNGYIKTTKTGTGIHNDQGHLMYKNISNQQRILFKQCKNNPKVICVLIIHCHVHQNNDTDKARYKSYEDLEQELSDYLDANYKKGGKVTFDKKSLDTLKRLYKNYKEGLGLRFGRENNQNLTFERLSDRLSSYAKEEARLLKKYEEEDDEKDEVLKVLKGSDAEMDEIFKMLEETGAKKDEILKMLEGTEDLEKDTETKGPKL